MGLALKSDPEMMGGIPSQNLQGPQAPTGSPQATNALLQGALEEVGKALALVQTSTSQNILTNGKNREEIGKVLINIADQSLQNAMTDLQNYLNAQAAAASSSFWGSIFGAIITAIVCVVSVATGNPELAVIGIALYLASSNVPGTNKSFIGTSKTPMSMLQDQVSYFLKDLGVPPSWAKACADILITVAIVAASAGASSALAAKAGATIAETAADAAVEEGTAETTAVATEETTSSVATTEGSASTVGKSAFARLKAAVSSLSRTQATAIFAAGAAASSTGLPTALSSAIAQYVHDKKAQEILSSILTVVFSIIAMGAEMAGGASLGMKGIAQGGRLISGVVFKASMITASGATLAQGGSQIATGANDVVKGESMGKLIQSQAAQEFLNSLSETNSASSNSFTKGLEDILKGLSSQLVADSKGMTAINTQAANLVESN